MAEHDDFSKDPERRQPVSSTTWPTILVRLSRRGSESSKLTMPSFEPESRSLSEPDHHRAEGRQLRENGVDGDHATSGGIERRHVEDGVEAGVEAAIEDDTVIDGNERHMVGSVGGENEVGNDDWSVEGEPARGTVEFAIGTGAGGRSTPKMGSIRRTFGRAIPQLPRHQTLKRQQSEKRNNLAPIQPTLAERRALSADRRPYLSVSPSASLPQLSLRSSAPDMAASYLEQASPAGRGAREPERARHEGAPEQPWDVERWQGPRRGQGQGEDQQEGWGGRYDRGPDSGVQGLQTPYDPSKDGCLFMTPTEPLEWPDTFEIDEGEDDGLGPVYAAGVMGMPSPPSDADARSLTSSEWAGAIAEELEKKWILNLSMHFRDKSKREKFFVTYRERGDIWRRVTVSLDYRDAAENSLEWDLSRTNYQRDKSAKIYEAIRDSLVDIKFYETVTNLKLQTTDGRLHVHVMEDTNEIIRYPPLRQVQHLGCRKIRESDVIFESHMSGFVYKVRVDGRTLIKKEIPGPDTIDEFLYEINALARLSYSRDVIYFYGVIVDDEHEHVKGLLISYAARGALIDIIFEHGQEHSPDLPWTTRSRWASQIIHGLADIHETGFVQGDFTLSNIVIDEHGDAKIIDINRRGCPVGWEPPEATALTEGGQRIFMYIGVKSDLYQLGMVLWALAMQVDEPETLRRPLQLSPDAGIPQWYRRAVESCLSPDPRRRLHASELLSLIPEDVQSPEQGRDRDSCLESVEVDTPHAPMVPPSVGHKRARSGSECSYDSSNSSNSNGSVHSRGTFNGHDSRQRPLPHPSTYPGAYPYPFTSHYPAPDAQMRQEIASKNLSAVPFDSFVYARGRSPTNRLVGSSGSQRDRSLPESSGESAWSFREAPNNGGGPARYQDPEYSDDDDDDDDDYDMPAVQMDAETEKENMDPQMTATLKFHHGPTPSDPGPDAWPVFVDVKTLEGASLADESHLPTDAFVSSPQHGKAPETTVLEGDMTGSEPDDLRGNVTLSAIASSEQATPHDTVAGLHEGRPEIQATVSGHTTPIHNACPPTLDQQPESPSASELWSREAGTPWTVHTMAGPHRTCSDPGSVCHEKADIDRSQRSDRHSFDDMPAGVLFGIRTFEELALAGGTYGVSQPTPLHLG